MIRHDTVRRKLVVFLRFVQLLVKV